MAPIKNRSEMVCIFIPIPIAIKYPKIPIPATLIIIESTKNGVFSFNDMVGCPILTLKS